MGQVPELMWARKACDLLQVRGRAIFNWGSLPATQRAPPLNTNEKRSVGPSACQDDRDTTPLRNAHGLPRRQEQDGWPIRAFNREIWGMLNWWAHQLDTPPWWRELVAIPGVEDPKGLAWKIWASFLIHAVRCEAFLSQGYTTPPPQMPH